MHSIHPLVVSLCFGIVAVSIASHAQQESATQTPRVPLLRGYLCEATDYPAAARRRETQGKVKIKFSVTPEGKIEDVAVIQSSGETKEHKLLDSLSKRQIQSCKLVEAASTLEARAHEIELVWKLR